VPQVNIEADAEVVRLDHAHPAALRVMGSILRDTVVSQIHVRPLFVLRVKLGITTTGVEVLILDLVKLVQMQQLDSTT